MLNKEEFIDIMEWIVKKDQLAKKANAALQEFSPEWGFFPIDTEWEGKLTYLLEKMMNDESSWIGYWLYDLDCGERWKEGMITDEDGSDIKLKTTEDLFSVLRNAQLTKRYEEELEDLKKEIKEGKREVFDNADDFLNHLDAD